MINGSHGFVAGTWRRLGVLTALLPFIAGAAAPDPGGAAGRFFGAYCTECHGTTKAKGKVTLHDFSFADASLEKLRLWEKVLGALEGGDMPPDEQKNQPSKQERAEMVAMLSVELRRKTQVAGNAEPRVAQARRLTNFEYGNTMRDLLGVDLKLQHSLPADPAKPYHFNNTAEFMLMGPEQVDHYLEAARRAMASVIVDEAPPAVVKKRGEWKSEKAPNQDLAPNEIGVWEQAPKQSIGVQNPPPMGEFRLRFRAAAKLMPFTKDVPLRFVIGQGLGHNLSTLRVEPVGTVHLRSETPQEYELRGRIENFPVELSAERKGKILPPSVTITPQNLFDDGTLNDNFYFLRPRSIEMPRVVLDWVEFECPLVENWPPEQHRRILFDSPLRKSDPKAYARAVLERFLPRAFRRPATPEEVARFSAMFDVLLPASADFEAAIRETLAMVLISPQFLYHTTADGHAVSPQYALASRLSYFLWGTMPDEELLELAAANQLADAKTIERQVLRMLADKRAADFVSNFTMQWLSLAKMRTVPINRKLFPRFLFYVPAGERAGLEFPYRPTVRDFMIDETVAFVGELIRRDANVLNVVHSDFAMLNQRLAAHYGIPGVEDGEIHAVPLKPEQNLGGLLTHGSVLIGNGTGTAPHPIYRAVWLREAILGEYVAPPPAEVPALSDSAGESAEKALSIKDLLAKHRTVEACNDCHARLDPWGIPFEQYNAIGQFQPLVPKDGTTVRAFDVKRDLTLDGYFAYLKTINVVPIDPVARLPKGPQVNGMKELKDFLIKNRADDIAENVIRRLLSYSIGRDLTVYDRPAIEAIVAGTKKKNWGMREILVQICQSQLFQTPNASRQKHAK